MTFPRFRMLTTRGFTLVELLVSMAVLTLLILLITQLFNSATTVTTAGNKHMDADSQARAALDRMAIDFGQMVKRGDVDYFVKDNVRKQGGNDQIAFYSEVPGYAATSPSPVSLVAYRINSDSSQTSYGKMQRLGKGLQWNGASAILPTMVYFPLTIAGTTASATDSSTDDDYELIGPQVFRFETSYLLKNGRLSDIPWDSAAGSSSINGWQDVAAIGVAIAVIDAKSRVIVSNSDLVTLAGQMNDFATTNQPGDMEKQWQDALNASSLPRSSSSAIRIYHRYFYLSPRLL